MSTDDGERGMDSADDSVEEFDFDSHRREAVDAYQRVQPLYEECAMAVYAVLGTALKAEGVLIHSIEARAKSPTSFGKKAATPDPNDPMQPKYADPLTEITDLAGVRVITFMLDAVDRANGVVEREFLVTEKIDKSGLLQEEEKLGYQSIHYLVRFSDSRAPLPEYARFAGMITEIQVRTILQHAWAEIEHDIQYKAVATIPTSIRRRFTSLAGLLEIADREFQAISDEDRRVRSDARRLVAAGELDRVEITPDALKAYLDRKYGADGRMSDWSYEWTTRLLKRLGYRNLREVDACVASYDDDRISRMLWSRRQGQLTRFEGVLLAGMGEHYVAGHPWGTHDWFQQGSHTKLEVLRKGGVPIGDYRPDALSATRG